MVLPRQKRTTSIPTSVATEAQPLAVAPPLPPPSPVVVHNNIAPGSPPPPSPSNRSLGKGKFSPSDGSVQEFDVSPLPSPSSSSSSSSSNNGNDNARGGGGRRYSRSLRTSASAADGNKAVKEGGGRGCSLSMPDLRQETTTTTQGSKNCHHSNHKRASSSLSLMAQKLKESSEKMISMKPFQRHLSSFLRVADLLSHMDDEMGEIDNTDGNTLASVSSSSDGKGTSPSQPPKVVKYPNYHHASVDPPPGMETDPQERWISLDDGDKKHSPIAPLAVRALAKSGLQSCFDQAMWQPADKSTTKLLSPQSSSSQEWKTCAWQRRGPVVAVPSKNRDSVLVWKGSFQHGLYGSELPAIRAAGVVGMSPRDLLDLLVDSDRVKEYNKLSLGRTDELVLQDNYADGPFGGVTKVMKSKSRPPLLRKTLLFTSILHARELGDRSGYKIVTRAVTTANNDNNQQQDNNNNNSSSKHSSEDTNVLTSEILMGVTIIKRIEGIDDQCLVITVNHIRSPMLPMMIAKRIGLQAASSFIHDLRSAANNNTTTNSKAQKVEATSFGEPVAGIN